MFGNVGMTAATVARKFAIPPPIPAAEKLGVAYMMD